MALTAQKFDKYSEDIKTAHMVKPLFLLKLTL